MGSYEPNAKISRIIIIEKQRENLFENCCHFLFVESFYVFDKLKDLFAVI